MRLSTIQNRLDKEAIEQLRAEVVRLDAKLTESENYRLIAEDSADYWESQCRALEGQLESRGETIGLCKDGSLVVLP